MISGFWQKLGFWSKDIVDTWKNKSNWIWFHAVSVGEFNALFPLIEEVTSKKSNYPIMISCTTNAGYNLAQEKIKNKNILLFYFPFDLPQVINSLLNYADVKLLVIAETEIWPITLATCKRKNIPVILVNARLSDKSFKNYYLLKFYFKNIVNLFTAVLTQSEKDTERFIKLGLDKEKIKTLGNIKFYSSQEENYSNGKNLIIENGDLSNTKIIFASTHQGEEELAINTFKDLLEEFSNLRLIIAPRHVNRTKDILNLVKNNGFNPILRSKGEKINSLNDIYILDTIGELIYLYKHCKITVLGGTFTKIGGHNILEPIKAGSYTIIGPYDFKINGVSDLFKRKNAIVQVNNSKDLKSKIKEALTNEKLIEKIIQNGKEIINENKNVFKHTAQQVLTYIQ